MAITGTDALPALTGPRARAGIRQTRQGSLAYPAKGARKVRGSSAPKRLGERLHRCRDAAQCLPSQGKDYAYATASVGPELKLWAVPQGGEEHLSRMGLSIPLNSQNRSRPGLSGPSVHGKKQIRRSSDLMDDFRSRCAMWTVTLTCLLYTSPSPRD